MLTATDVLQSSASLLYKPKNPEQRYYYPDVNATKILSNSMTYALFFSIILLLFGGIIYDLFGRLTTVSFMFAMGALSTIMPPYVAPNVPAYVFSKVVFNSSTVPLQMNPFINDYVKVQYRGKAMGLQTFGLTIGNLLSVAVMYSLTSMITDKNYAFLLLASL